jgi:iron complex outermembrane receptor protein
LKVFGSGPPPFIADNYSNGDRFGISPTGGPVRQEINRLSGDATIKYQVADEANVFFRYARGFKSGAFDTRANASLAGSGANVPTGPETVDAYEIGLKSNPSPSLQFNASAFYYDQKDLQIFDTGPLGPQFLNLPGSRVIGVEVDSIWAVTESTTLQFAGGWLDTEITDVGTLTTVDEGHDLPNSPHYSFNIAGSQDVTLGGNRLNLNAAFRYIGEQKDSLQFSQDFYSTKGAQTYLDIRATYMFGKDENLQFSVFGQNLTGENFCGDLGSNAPVDDTVASGFINADSPQGQTVNCQPGNEGVPLWGVSLQASF